MEQEKIKVDITNYESFWGMLNSVDKENTVVAMTILNNADFRESLPYILMLLKSQQTSDKREWLDNAPELKTRLHAIGIEETTELTYKFIVNKVKNTCSAEGIQFVLNKFTPVLHGYLIQWGFDFMSDVNVSLTLKPKENETT